MSRLTRWAPAVVTAVALYGFPWALAFAFGGGGWWWVLLAADVLVLAAVAIFLWSPLVVLAAAIVSDVFWAIAVLGASSFDTCGTATTASVVEIGGGTLLALSIGTWGVRRGPRVLWAVPVGWIAYAVWIVIWAHVIPGGTGGCFP
jgi:hypothetical protein